LRFELLDEVADGDFPDEPQAGQAFDEDGVVEFCGLEFFDVGFFHCVASSAFFVVAIR
jgi:hypothetical protein